MTSITRRDWLQWMAMSAALAGCDRLSVEVTAKPGGFATSDGIVPITPNEGFYVYQYGLFPDVDPETWTMEFRGAEGARTIDASFFDDLVPMEIEYTLQCIGGNPRNTLISNAVWGGLPLEAILERLGLSQPEDALEILFLGADRYSTSVPVSDFEDGRIWVVWEMNGEPLPFDHGAPCRFLVTGRYGTKNVKWPLVCEFIDRNHVGYWESTGWSADATYLANGFIFQPMEGQLESGEVLVFGTAYAGSDPIESVEVRYDDGPWIPAEITYSPGPDRWTLWRSLWMPTGSGDHTVECRVTTASGATSQGNEATDFSNGYDGGMRVQFRVAIA